MTKRRLWLGAVIGISAALAASPRPALCAPQAAEKAPADDLPKPRELDVWGRFAEGSWKQAKITTESLDLAGKVTATTTSRVLTTLLQADARRFKLRISMSMEIDGRRLDAEPRIVERGYFGEAPGEPVTVRDIGSAMVKIGGSEYPCLSRETSVEADGRRTITRLLQSAAQAPFFLRRETRFIDLANPSAGHEDQTEVLTLDTPYRVVDEIQPVSFERTVQKSAGGSVVTLDATSVEVPGGVASRVAKELDPQGRLVRRVTMDLLAYRAVEDQDQPPPPRDDNSGHRRRRRRRSW